MKKLIALWVLVLAVAGMFSCSDDHVDVSLSGDLETRISGESRLEIDAPAKEYKITATNVKRMFIVNAYDGETKKQLNVVREQNNASGKNEITATGLKEGWLYATTASKNPNQLHLVAATNISGKDRSVLLVLDCDGDIRTYTVIQKAK